MPDWLGKLLSDVVKQLRGHEEAVLALSLAVLGAVLLIAGTQPVLAAGLPVAIYIVFSFRMEAAARHKEEMARLEIAKIEAQLGKPTKARAQRAIARRRGTPHDGKHR